MSANRSRKIPDGVSRVRARGRRETSSPCLESSHQRRPTSYRTSCYVTPLMCTTVRRVPFLLVHGNHALNHDGSRIERIVKRQYLALRGSVLGLGLAAAALAAGGCINIFWRTEARALHRTGADSVRLVRTPVKAHLADGSTVVFRHGASIGGRQITGAGEAYALFGDTPTSRNSVPLDSVVGLETFEGKVLQAQTPRDSRTRSRRSSSTATSTRYASSPMPMESCGSTCETKRSRRIT